MLSKACFDFESPKYCFSNIDMAFDGQKYVDVDFRWWARPRNFLFDLILKF